MANPPADARPSWSLDPFKRFLEYLETERRLLALATRGIGSITGGEEALKTLYEPILSGKGYTSLKNVTPDEAKVRIEQAARMGELAQSELDSEFPLLHAHSLLGIWGALEALVEDVVRAWLTHRKRLLADSEALNAVKVPLALFLGMRPSERIDYLIDNVQRSGAGAGGFPRFEALLRIVDLHGPLDEKLRRMLIEVHETRNVYAHRGGVADRKARQACPWRRDWKIGQPLLVGHERYNTYTNAVVEYVFELIVRSGAKFGVDARELAQQAPKREDSQATP